ncbi:hypothetical protein B4098_2734 [Heyndrickxia coagulans]|uniref:Uncharacterized protein n=1 Tax=Heyndrickxia coagulans TaxID=1398 RepID=A0A150K9U8_HEYCO|nr:hypothetical protein B4098_2734 [Heyndrickxia coagulans]
MAQAVPIDRTAYQKNEERSSMLSPILNRDARPREEFPRLKEIPK